jgi:hypothetical protein
VVPVLIELAHAETFLAVLLTPAATSRRHGAAKRESSAQDGVLKCSRKLLRAFPIEAFHRKDSADQPPQRRPSDDGFE